MSECVCEANTQEEIIEKLAITVTCYTLSHTLTHSHKLANRRYGQQYVAAQNVYMNIIFYRQL